MIMTTRESSIRKLNPAIGPGKQISPSSQSFRWSGLLLLLIVLAGALPVRAQSQPPVIFFSDLDSGPNSGGESVSGFSGTYVTLYGLFFGASQGSSTITWNGQNCLRVVSPTGSYNGWGTPYLRYQQIVVQLGSGCTAGSG